MNKFLPVHFEVLGFGKHAFNHQKVAADVGEYGHSLGRKFSKYQISSSKSQIKLITSYRVKIKN
jgi:hypothetical protein